MATHSVICSLINCIMKNRVSNRLDKQPIFHIVRITEGILDSLENQLYFPMIVIKRKERG